MSCCFYMNVSDLSMVSELSNLRPRGKSRVLCYKQAVIIVVAPASITDIFIYDINLIL